MDQFRDSLQQHAEFPNNLVAPDTYPHSMHAYSRRLTEQGRRLFCDESKASLQFLECGDQGQGFQEVCIDSFGDLELHLGPDWEDPRVRFMFITAPNSRERLNVTRDMFSYLFTFHQVMTGFMDFVFTYGRRENAQESHFGGFRQDCRLADHLKGPLVRQLNRSGRDIRHCYNLISVESSAGQRVWPWSVRQTAIYHSFDVITGRASWIVIKANREMKQRVQKACEAFGESESTRFQKNSRAFASSLYFHLIYISWAGEEWRWYIDFLEDETQKATRKTLSADVENTAKGIFTAVQASQAQLRPSRRFQQKPAYQFAEPMTPPCSPPRSPPRSPQPSSTGFEIPKGVKSTTSAQQREFSFTSLQRIQFLEEKANETILVIDLNLSVLGDLKQFYESLLESDEFPEELSKGCVGDVAKFVNRVATVEHDLRLQRSRSHSLLRVLADRKNLMFAMLEYQNEQATRLLAEKAQSSAGHMETMTEEMHAMTRGMHELAQKTKQETISMKIITLVTLFFLPGTFISTLMSTDIVRWDSNGEGENLTRTVSVGAIFLFLEITLPLMLFTFTAWYGVYWWVNRRDGSRSMVCKHRSPGA